MDYTVERIQDSPWTNLNIIKQETVQISSFVKWKWEEVVVLKDSFSMRSNKDREEGDNNET